MRKSAISFQRSALSILRALMVRTLTSTVGMSAVSFSSRATPVRLDYFPAQNSKTSSRV